MYRSAQTVRIFLCALLLTGYGLFWALATLHPLLEHEHQPHCQAEPGTSHLHTSEYEYHPCFLCDCTLSSFAELNASSRWQLTPPTPDFEVTPNFYFSPACISPPALPALRGPPNRA